jgi:hypothetical protein
MIALQTTDPSTPQRGLLKQEEQSNWPKTEKKKNQVKDPKGAPDTKMNWPSDRRSQNQHDPALGALRQDEPIGCEPPVATQLWLLRRWMRSYHECSQSRGRVPVELGQGSRGFGIRFNLLARASNNFAVSDFEGCTCEK